VEVDEKKAYEKFMTAAALQMTKRPYRVFEGQTYFALGYCCENGRGTEKDYRRALNWYKEAREHKVTKADAKFLELLALTTATETQKMQKTTSVLSRAQALERLDVKEGASKEVMRAAYMRLIKQMHPDKGGSNFFTKQLNEVRDVLNL
jgi:TPR repeat protein